MRVFGQHEIGAPIADQLLRPVAQDVLDRTVAVDGAGVQVTLPDPVLAALDDGPEALLAVAQREFDALARLAFAGAAQRPVYRRRQAPQVS